MKFYGKNDEKIELENEEVVNEILKEMEGKDLKVEKIEFKLRCKLVLKLFIISMF